MHELHVVELAHGSAVVQLDQCQSLQKPLDGPPDVPVAQVPVSLQKPQVAPEMHELHVVELAHGSAAAQLVHAQALHVPLDGPPDVPVMHVPVSPQKPQVEPAMHALHDVELAHGSLDVHPLEYHTQSEQLPLDGPDDVPVAHVPELGQYPHALIDVHESQPDALAHGSPVPLQPLGYHVQLAQVPVDGPVDVPVAHVLVLEQYPHAAIDVHASQPAAPAHGSVVLPPHSLVYQRHVAHVPEVGPVEEPVWHMPVASQNPHG